MPSAELQAALDAAAAAAAVIRSLYQRNLEVVTKADRSPVTEADVRSEQAIHELDARYGALCAACHGDPEGVGGRAPEMEAPDALTGASLTLARFEDQDPRRPRAPAEVGDATRVEVDFRRDVQPILDRRCGGCHAGDAPAAGLDLSGAPTTHFTRSYEHLLRPGDGSGGGRAYVDDDDGRADRSFLIERLTGIERAAPRALPAPGVPHPADLGAAALTDDELRVLARWIDLGATFVGAAPAEAP